MRKEILLIDPAIAKDAWAESYVSFKVFTRFLQDKIATGEGIKTRYYQFVLDKIAAFPELQGNIRIDEIHRYEEILEIIATIVFPIIEDENEFYWAFGNALTPEVFYGSNAFYNLLHSASQGYAADPFIVNTKSSEAAGMLYELILPDLYNYGFEKRKEWIYGFINPASGLYTYFRINIDKRFTTIKNKTELPRMEKQDIDACLSGADGLKQLESLLPLKNMFASGFTIITLNNVTSRQALEQISKVIAGMTAANNAVAFKQVTLLLQTLAGSRHYQFGLMPVLTINKRAALLYENFPFSIIVKTCLEQGVPKKTFDAFMKSFLKSPSNISHSRSLKNGSFPEAIQNALDSVSAPFYSLAPVYAGDRLVGIFEVSTDGTELSYDNQLRDSLAPAIPFIAQLMQFFIDKFNAAIDAIIKDKFTNIQPAVQWKFNEAAWHYFRSHLVEKKNTPIENISFSGVYPLYGAIDIQNSTIERNGALRDDLLVQLNLLKQVLQLIDGKHSVKAEQLIASSDHWLARLHDFINIEQELELNDFLLLEVTPYLSEVQQKASTALSRKILQYQDAADEADGAAFIERRKLESSIHTINSAVGQYLDLFKVELQASYPCYFEKMRTDGVEYDIYLGQSIAPRIPFKTEHLQGIRLIQLEAMSAITRLTYTLLPQLPYPLQTTQLVFVHSRPIDISFRNDERRFDVEGAYNIRYHIIKKRIDKVHILHTNERLVQVGKIAIVYYNEKDIGEYEGYISQLQEKRILSDDLEHLELEELQGVSGLRALRVGVSLA